MINNDIYKKSGLMRMNIARDFYLMDPGGRIPTILEYTEQFSVSRGIVQNAIRQLEEDGCIAIEKRGSRARFCGRRTTGSSMPAPAGAP